MMKKLVKISCFFLEVTAKVEWTERHCSFCWSSGCPGFIYALLSISWSKDNIKQILCSFPDYSLSSKDKYLKQTCWCLYSYYLDYVLFPCTITNLAHKVVQITQNDSVMGYCKTKLIIKITLYNNISASCLNSPLIASTPGNPCVGLFVLSFVKFV